MADTAMARIFNQIDGRTVLRLRPLYLAADVPPFALHPHELSMVLGQHDRRPNGGGAFESPEKLKNV